MEIKTDFLIIGSGVAGLMFALKVAEHGDVTIVTKKEVMDSNTTYAQGGVASVFDKLDSFKLHVNDTMAAGSNLCNLEVVEKVVKNGPDRIRELIDFGVKFNQIESKKGDLKLDLGQEGGHSQKRIVHALDMTGREIETVLVEHVKNHEKITLLEDHIAVDLITRSKRFKSGLIVTEHESQCCGAYILDIKNDVVKTFNAKITLLATGGAGKAYAYTSNPDVATGDGIAMAYRAGASIANMEFVQFHPTCLFHPEAKNFLISEAVRGEGGILVNASGERFMERYDSKMELACRDVVSRAIDCELKKSGDDSVFLDISHKDADFVKKRFPTLYANCKKFGYDMTKEPIPVVPAAHYFCGGVATDINGKTDIKRLFVIGEAACTGLHGANRLASNSLLEALVYADVASDKALEDIKEIKYVKELPVWDEAGSVDSDEAIMVSHNWDEIRRCMWNYVGVVRSDKRLARARRRIENIQREIAEYYWDFRITLDLIELRNIATVAEQIIKCAQLRKESRGLHYNIEYPEQKEEYLRDTVIKRPLSGK
ncbi:MAG: L-aspartate oxidase [Desulfobacterales bacterium]|nr:L-aspartate oxidase [Desulfobacterales bacterium]MCP4161018.1 L-aspartate oxidase [Deltaproteobacteria bacterium]